MNVIDFIEADNARARVAAARLWGVGAGIAGACVAVAFALRADFNEVFTVWYLAPAVGMLAALAAYPMLAAKKASRAVWIGVGAVLALTCARPGFPFGTVYATDAAFWREAEACFVKGLGASLVVGGALAVMLFRQLPLPTRAWRMATAAAAGGVAVVMLNLHCASGHVGHIVVGHWLPAVPVAALVYGAQSWAVARRLRGALGASAGAMDRVGQLDR